MEKFCECPRGLKFVFSEALVAILFAIWSEVIFLLELSMLSQVQWCTSVGASCNYWCHDTCVLCVLILLVLCKIWGMLLIFCILRSTAVPDTSNTLSFSKLVIANISLKEASNSEFKRMLITEIAFLLLFLSFSCTWHLWFGTWAQAHSFISSGPEGHKASGKHWFCRGNRVAKWLWRVGAGSSCLWESCWGAELLSLGLKGLWPGWGQTKGRWAHLWADVPRKSVCFHQPPKWDCFHSCFRASHRI